MTIIRCTLKLVLILDTVCSFWSLLCAVCMEDNNIAHPLRVVDEGLA